MNPQIAPVAPVPPGLLEQCKRQLRRPELARILADCCPEPGDSEPIDTAIHPDCQMLAHSLRHHEDPALAISQYFSVALQQFHAAAQAIDRLSPGGEDLEFLDFACGFGRLLTFLVHRLPRAAITAAEIQPEAVEWVAQRHGIRALQSAARPEEFLPSGPDRRGFDLVWVASLFSHLPDGLFQRWLRRLGGLLAPDGFLWFTVHDEALLPTETELPARGMLYIESSENPQLSPEIYGTTYVSEDYVRRAIGDALGDARYLRLPRLIGFEQDVYVVGRDAGADPSIFGGIRRGLRGWVDERRVAPDGALEIAGWAGSMDGGGEAAVEITLDGKRVACQTGQARPRVAEVLGRPELANCGWSCRIEPSTLREGAYLRVRAVGNRGRDCPALIFAGPAEPAGFSPDRPPRTAESRP